jgi:hypothetical protein
MSRDIGHALMLLRLEIATDRLQSWAPNLARAMKEREQIDFLLRR